jgi:tripartite-type tricarboxylate transporter receptor subunit TctC
MNPFAADLSLIARAGAVCLAFLTVPAHLAQAQDDPVAAFYRGKTLTIMVGSDSGGGYDLNARLLARYMVKYIPGHPQIIVQNKPGASSLAAALYVANVAPRDGTYIAAVQRPVPFQPLFGAADPRLDLRKIQWLGSTTKEPGVFVAWHTAPQRSLDDLRRDGMIVGGNGPSTDTELFARALNNLAGTKLKIVSGYPGQVQIILAMERGEVQGVANWSWSDIESKHEDWLRDGKIRMLLQLGLTKNPKLPDVPFILDLAHNDAEHEILKLLMEMKALGRPYFITPGVPPERVQALRAAFNATMQDKEFQDEGAATVGVIDPVSGEEMQTMLGAVYDLPASLMEQARQAVGVKAP